MTILADIVMQFTPSGHYTINCNILNRHQGYILKACLLAVGVVAVAVFGLYGSATSKFDISPKLVESGSFESFWDTFAFLANGIVFFFAGASSLNFIIRCGEKAYIDFLRALLRQLRQKMTLHALRLVLTA